MMKDLIRKKTGSRWIVFVLAALIGSTLAIGEAQAIPMLMLDDGPGGGATVTISDNGAGDLNPLAGAITFSGALGNFILNVSTGITKPIMGSAGAPHMDLNSVDVATSGGALTISFTDTGFTTLDPGLTFFQSSIGGVSLTGTVTFSSFLDSSNTPFGTATSLGSQTFGPGAFSGVFSSPNLPSAFPYSLTEVVTISLPGAGTASFDAELQAAPEPGSLILLGSGLAGLGLLGWRRAKRNKK